MLAEPSQTEMDFHAANERTPITSGLESGRLSVDGSFSSVRRNSYVQARESEDMVEWQYLPIRRSDGDLLSGGLGSVNRRQNTMALSTPVLAHWNSTGSMVIGWPDDALPSSVMSSLEYLFI